MKIYWILNDVKLDWCQKGDSKCKHSNVLFVIIRKWICKTTLTSGMFCNQPPGELRAMSFIISLLIQYTGTWRYVAKIGFDAKFATFFYLALFQFITPLQKHLGLVPFFFIIYMAAILNLKNDDCIFGIFVFFAFKPQRILLFMAEISLCVLYRYR